MILKDIKECYTSLSAVGESKIAVVIATLLTLLTVVIVVPLAKLYWWVDKRQAARAAKKEI